MGGWLVGGHGGGKGGERGFTCAIAVVVVNWDAGLVDGQLFEVGAAVAVQLGVEVGEETALQQRVLGEIDSADDVAGLELVRLDWFVA